MSSGGRHAGRPGLDVRPPLQQRSREAWARVLDAGVAIVEDGGYEAFTIAAVCARAGIAPRAIYARVDTKDALFLAVYEHGLARVRADQRALVDLGTTSDLRGEPLVCAAVDVLVALFARHHRLLRSVVLVSGAHPEVTRRGTRYGRELADQFTAVLLGYPEDIEGLDPETSVRAAFGVMFSALVFRTAYGTGFTDRGTSLDPLAEAGPDADEGLRGDPAFSATLATMVSRYLFHP